jgi:hypothetical protein
MRVRQDFPGHRGAVRRCVPSLGQSGATPALPRFRPCARESTVSRARPYEYRKPRSGYIKGDDNSDSGLGSGAVQTFVRAGSDHAFRRRRLVHASRCDAPGVLHRAGINAPHDQPHAVNRCTGRVESADADPGFSEIVRQEAPEKRREGISGGDSFPHIAPGD